MRILHVIRGLANSSGTTHIVNPLAEAQGRAGAHVRVLHVDKPNAPSVEPDPRWVASRRFPLSIPFDNPGLSWSLARAMPAEIADCDVLHVHAIWNFPSWWAMRCAARASKPYIVAPQGSFDPWAMRQNIWGKRLYGALTELPLLRRATRMQALTEKEVRQFREGGLLGPAVIIPNGIPAATLETQRNPGGLARKLSLPDGSRTLLFLSRVHPKKGLDTLVAAFARLCKVYDDVYLIIAGNDAGTGYATQIESLTRELGVADRCRFLGEVAGTVKAETLSGADGYALISRSEGLPVAAIEAMGAGLPLVLSTECNLPEISAHNAGWIVPPEPEAAATALIELYADTSRAQARGTQARVLVTERFTWDRIAEQSLQTYAVMCR